LICRGLALQAEFLNQRFSYLNLMEIKAKGRKQFSIAWVIILFFLSGCATYKFHYGAKPYNKGYVVSRDASDILEYTLGKDNSVPELKLAKERFTRRRKTVEYYYKQMGYIEDKFKQTFLDYPVMFLKMLGGVFRLPSLWIADYKYAHDPKYRERIDRLNKEEEEREQARLDKLKGELSAYIQKDLAQESP
jgi:hypothetical protein